MDTADTIEVTNGTSSKRVSVQTSRGRATVFWTAFDQYDVDMETGDIRSQVVPLRGVFSVDCMTGRVVGTRCSVAAADLVKLETVELGDSLALEHDVAGKRGERLRAEVQVVDLLRSEGTFKIYVRPERGLNHVGVTYATGWRVAPKALQMLRAQAGVLACAS